VAEGQGRHGVQRVVHLLAQLDLLLLAPTEI
jgi:hypothetical protein